jgi:hypothetical protein
MTRSSLADACDNHFPGDVPAVVPHTVLGLGDGSLTAFYRCPVCGWRWFTGWDARAASWPGDRRAA